MSSHQKFMSLGIDVSVLSLLSAFKIKIDTTDKAIKTCHRQLNPNKGDVREALPGARGGHRAPASFSALESPKGQKSCFHTSLDHFQLI